MSFKTIEEFENAIPATHEEYEEHMIRTGQWMSWNDYVNFIDYGLDETVEELEYVSATHGC